MTKNIHINNGWKITLNKSGSADYVKMSYPLRYGIYSEIESKDAVFQFNLNNEITFAKGKGGAWIHPQEWLKRTIGNDWIYYSTGGYTGVYEALGEYYLPNLQYPTNNLMGGRPFETECVNDLVTGWYDHLLMNMSVMINGSADVHKFIVKVVANTPERLAIKAEQLFQTSGGRVTVLPPDCRHVDYDIIPLTISCGCLYKCRFCKVKSTKPFQEKNKEEIKSQISKLKEIYAEDLTNYNSVFLGEHDALCGSSGLILYSIKRAYEEFDFASSTMRGTNFFLFGSVDSLLNVPEHLFTELSRMPCSFYINIGLESADQNTLDHLGKPITSAMVEEAFTRIQDINDRYSNIEITANFLMEESLPPNHYPSFLKLVRDSFLRPKPKGSIYLSPLKFGNPSRELMFDFNRLKLLSRLPTYLYIIQRL